MLQEQKEVFKNGLSSTFLLQLKHTPLFAIVSLALSSEICDHSYCVHARIVLVNLQRVFFSGGLGGNGGLVRVASL